MTIDVVPRTPHIGAEIRGLDLTAELDGETVAAIRRAWLDRHVARRFMSRRDT